MLSSGKREFIASYTGACMNSKNSMLSGVKVLIVDDEPDSLALLEHLLIHFDAQVIAARNAAEGLERVQTHRPDVIVSDIGMPDMDGYEFIQEIRNLPADDGGQTPAVAFTAFNSREDQRKALSAGFQKHLSKPVDVTVLIDTIASMIGTKSH
jgi:CheY-like chemotaxis protein